MRCAIPLPDLAAPMAVAAPPPPDPALLEALREDAMAEGHARGFAEGLAEGMRRQREAQEASIAASLGLAAAALDDAAAHAAAVAERTAEHLARTVLAVVDAALPTEGARRGPEMAAALAAKLLPLLKGQPEVLLRVAPEQAAAVASLVPAGLVVEGDAALAAGDARLEWRDGAQTLSLDARRAAIRAALTAAGLWSADEP
ncbi:FliH/SctL family protein [Falsiroseomonas oryziterrae]|uniref:FliH/SctL family protein n=1 Tax=Falsiroseomonas oryziterrae TaxID=2911368 RepID=UPI001F2B361B|nr:FliH/SctL family protein [Roseomonas sp. NPKOSM-4]